MSLVPQTLVLRPERAQCVGEPEHLQRLARSPGPATGPARGGASFAGDAAAEPAAGDWA